MRILKIWEQKKMFQIGDGTEEKAPWYRYDNIDISIVNSMNQDDEVIVKYELKPNDNPKYQNKVRFLTYIAKNDGSAPQQVQQTVQSSPQGVSSVSPALELDNVGESILRQSVFKSCCEATKTVQGMVSAESLASYTISFYKEALKVLKGN